MLVVSNRETLLTFVQDGNVGFQLPMTGHVEASYPLLRAWKFLIPKFF